MTGDQQNPQKVGATDAPGAPAAQVEDATSAGAAPVVASVPEANERERPTEGGSQIRPSGEPRTAGSARSRARVLRWAKGQGSSVLTAALTAAVIAMSSQSVARWFTAAPPRVQASCEWNVPHFLEHELGLGPLVLKAVALEDGTEKILNPTMSDLVLRFDAVFKNTGGEAKSVSIELENVFAYDTINVSPSFQAKAFTDESTNGRSLVLQGVPPNAEITVSVVREPRNGADPPPTLARVRVAETGDLPRTWSALPQATVERWRRIGVAAQSKGPRPKLPSLLNDEQIAVQSLVDVSRGAALVPSDLNYVAILPSSQYRALELTLSAEGGTWRRIEPFMVSDIRYCRVSLDTWRAAFAHAAKEQNVVQQAVPDSIEWCDSVALRWRFLSEVEKRIRKGESVTYGGYKVAFIVPTYQLPVIEECRQLTEQMLRACSR